MKHQRNPTEAKALDYRVEHRYAYEDPHIERRSLPKRKQLRNQIYRSRLRRSLDQAIHGADVIEDISPDKVIRGKSQRHGRAVPLKEWLDENQQRRISQIAWNYFKRPYEGQRDRDRFVAFITSLTEGRSAHSRRLAEQFAGLLSGVDAALLEYLVANGVFSPNFALHQGRIAAAWLRAFFNDEPGWEKRLRDWIDAIQGT